MRPFGGYKASMRVHHGMLRSTRALAALFTGLALVGCDPAGGVAPATTGRSPAPEARAISGVARYEGLDAPHGGITVRLVGPEGAAETTTDQGGGYGFEHLPAGRYALSFLHAAYVTATRSVTLEAASASVEPVLLSNHRPIYASATLYDPRAYASRTSLVLAPDGEHLAFVEEGVLKTVPLAGGAATPVRDLQPPTGSVVDSFDWTAHGLAYALVEAGASSSLWVTTGADPTGAVVAATRSADLRLCPSFGPDGTELAYLARVREPWTMADAHGAYQLAVVKQARNADTATRLASFPINPSWDYGFGPLTWTPSGLLFHKPMFCDIYRNDPSFGPVGDGIFLLSTAGALQKLYYYSNYEHCLSGDGQVLYLHEGRRIVARRVDEPGPYNQGQVPVGYDRTGMVGPMVMGKAGDRLYYVSGRGIEEMMLLSAGE